MGKVYRARDTRLDREVALKVLWPQLAEQPAAVARFEREARAVARLQHANVVAVHDIGAADGYHYLAMEYVAGCSLRELLKQALPVDKTLHYFKQILSGLGVAHEQGVIHRDLKPGNILIESATDTVKLADFGLARIIKEEVTLTRSGEMLGTLEYMAPELGRGECAGRKTDLYAAGVVLYRLLTGRLPFQGATPSAILKAHECGTYPLASTVMAGLSSQADAVLARLLACEPANRYADCQAVFADLEKWERGGDIPPEFAAAYEPIDHELERHRVPGWKRAWARMVTWYRYQWLELFNRTELTAVRLRDEVSAAENELGQARRRREEAMLLRNRVRARADLARAAMRECETAAELAHAAGDETQTRQHLAAKLEAKERAEELGKEAGESELVLKLARQEYEGKAAASAEQRHNADLLLARRRRAKLEMSVLGVLSAGERRLGERLLAAAKLFAPLLLAGIGLHFLLRSDQSVLPVRTMAIAPTIEATPVIVPPAIPPSPSLTGQEALTPPDAVDAWKQYGPPTTPRATPPSIPSPYGALLTARSELIAARLGDRVIAVTGFHRQPTYMLDVNEILDLRTRRWSQGTPYPLLASATCGTALGDELFVCGGFDGWHNRREAYIYNPNTDAWRACAPMPYARNHTPAVVAADGRVYVIGCEPSGNDPYVVQIYDPVANSWETRTGPAGIGGYATAAGLGDRIYIFGGNRMNPNESISDVMAYYPATYRWQRVASMPEANAFAAAVVWKNRIYVFGGLSAGLNGARAVMARVQIYDPATNRWTTGRDMAQARCRLAAVPVDDGILLLGGTDINSNGFDAAELYVP